MPVEVQGLDALASVQIGEEGFLVYKTLFTQEMLKRGYLGTTLCYICTEHTPEVVSAYAEAVDEVFVIIGKCRRPWMPRRCWTDRYAVPGSLG